MRICVYTRVSTDEQAESLKNQKIYFEDYLTKNKQYEPFRDNYIYSDLGLTGTRLNNRPAFFEMLRDAGLNVENVNITATVDNGNKDARRKHTETVFTISERAPLFDLILLKNTSRFARNTLSYDIINKLRRKGVHILFIEQNINTADVANDFFLKLFQLFDEQDSRDKSLKVRTGIAASNIKNTIRTTKRIYGYIYHKDSNSLEIIPDEAATIKKIYALYLDGLGLRQIENALNAEGITTREGRPFCKSTIRRILTNEKYAGLNALSKYTYGPVFNKNSYAHINEGYEVIPNERIPAIISPDDFDKVQALFNSKINHKQHKGVYNGVSKYNSRIYCGCCGAPYYSNRDKGRIYYLCKTKKMRGLNACDNVNISQNKLDALINDAYINSPDIIRRKKEEKRARVLYLLYKIITEGNTASTEDIEKTKSQIATLESKIARLFDLFALDLGGADVLKRQIASIDDELKTARARLALLLAPCDKVKQDVLHYKKVLDFIDIMPDYIDSVDEFLKYTYIEIMPDDVVIDITAPDGRPVLQLTDFERFGVIPPFFSADAIANFEKVYYDYLENNF